MLDRRRSLEAFIGPWSGSAFRHIPDGSPYDVLDFRFAGSAQDNRWNRGGEPTLYLASHRAVALAEFARHLEEEHAPDRPPQARRRAVFRLSVALDAVLDLVDPAVTALLSLTPREVFLDKLVCRATAGFVRATTPAQAIRVPSVAFLDDPTRWVLVLFLEKLPADRRAFIQRVRRVGIFDV